MRNIGDDFFLIVIHVFKLCGHIVKRGRQISHFVMCADRDLIGQISEGILAGCFGNLAERPVHKTMEAQQKNERKRINGTQCDIYRCHDRTAPLINNRDRTVDKKVSFS